jgi:hypothetical protein
MRWDRRNFLKNAAAVVGFPLISTSWASPLFSAPDGPNTLSEEDLLEELERTAFEFFWNEADPQTGLVRDRANANGVDARLTSSIAATGFGLTALCIGHQRNYRPPAEIVERVRRSLRFLANDAQQVNGFLYHFVDMRNGIRLGFSELSPIDMAILLCGVLSCRAYFSDQEIRDFATRIYHRVEWPWALNGADTFAMHWTPELEFSQRRWGFYCESVILYLLALGSPTHPIPVQSWRSIRRPYMAYEDYRYISISAPLFIHQYPHAWFDLRGKQDDYANYFENSVVACRAHRRFCERLSTEFPCYSNKVWGITASDSDRGYVVWGGPPLQGPIDGTIVPAASAGSLPFLYQESLAVLRNLRASYGHEISKRYGFVDAFNPLTGWASSDVIGIDLGISMLMAENVRTGLIWNTFMKNAEARTALELAGFRPAGLVQFDDRQPFGREAEDQFSIL